MTFRKHFNFSFLIVLLVGSLSIQTANAQDCTAFSNPNMDQVSTCPDWFGQVDRFTGWSQTTISTSDGFCDCSTSSPWLATSLGQCPSFATNFLGFYTYSERADGTNKYVEYVGQCLGTPFQAGEFYEVSFKIYQTLGTHTVPINVMGYQGTTCPSTPVSPGTDGKDELCGEANWVVLDSQTETSNVSDNGWTTMTYTFIAPSDISYVAFGSCAYTGHPLFPNNYFVIDEFCVPSNPTCDISNVNLDCDGDGVLNGVDCDPADAAVAVVVGDACDAGQGPGTGTIDASCNCVCDLSDATKDCDGDGVLNGVDCDPSDATINYASGNTCDDGNPLTTNDVVDGSCNCAGATCPGLTTETGGVVTSAVGTQQCVTYNISGDAATFDISDIIDAGGGPSSRITEVVTVSTDTGLIGTFTSTDNPASVEITSAFTSITVCVENTEGNGNAADVTVSTINYCPVSTPCNLVAPTLSSN